MQGLDSQAGVKALHLGKATILGCTTGGGKGLCPGSKLAFV